MFRCLSFWQALAGVTPGRVNDSGEGEGPVRNVEGIFSVFLVDRPQPPFLQKPMTIAGSLLARDTLAVGCIQYRSIHL
jgi:hypothetical protein